MGGAGMHAGLPVLELTHARTATRDKHQRYHPQGMVSSRSHCVRGVSTCGFAIAFNGVTRHSATRGTDPGNCLGGGPCSFDFRHGRVGSTDGVQDEPRRPS
ncbi:hypothetical protein MTO96_007597 [Rhipicephalus appendiculatus]